MAEKELRYALIQFWQDCGSIKAGWIGQQACGNAAFFQRRHWRQHGAMATFGEVHDDFASRKTRRLDRFRVKPRDLLYILCCADQAQCYARRLQRRGVEISRIRHHGHGGLETRVKILVQTFIRKPPRDDTARHPQFDTVQPVALEQEGKPHARRKVLLDVLLAVLPEAVVGPLAASQRKRSVSTRRSSEDANLVQCKNGRQKRVGGERIDCSAYLGGAPGPARRSRLGRIQVVSTGVLRQCDHKPIPYQCACQVDMNPGRTTRAMRNHYQTPVALCGFGIVCPGQLKWALRDTTLSRISGIKDRRLATIGLGMLGKTHLCSQGLRDAAASAQKNQQGPKRLHGKPPVKCLQKAKDVL